MQSQAARLELRPRTVDGVRGDARRWQMSLEGVQHFLRLPSLSRSDAPLPVALYAATGRLREKERQTRDEESEQ